jgi:hypothetical protein
MALLRHETSDIYDPYSPNTDYYAAISPVPVRISVADGLEKRVGGLAAGPGQTAGDRPLAHAQRPASGAQIITASPIDSTFDNVRVAC